MAKNVDCVCVLSPAGEWPCRKLFLLVQFFSADIDEIPTYSLNESFT